MPEPEIFLITGTNRGLGRGLMQALLQRPNTTVIAATRSGDGGPPLAAEAHSTSRLLHVKIDSRSATDALDAAKRLREEFNITRIDVLIASAGISKTSQPAAVTPCEDILDCIEVNTLAPLRIFQAMLPLIKNSPSSKFVVISSIAGSLGGVSDYASACTAYGLSKAAVNFLVRRIARENEDLIALALHPGWIQTDMGNNAAIRIGKKQAPVTVDESVQGILDEIKFATRERAATFRTYEHNELPW
ncbi:hypothetical protein V8C35DRAFT_318982 [Trichoderma chlorosporum]